jgi:Protein of unknown function (DUF3592)
MLAPKIIAGVMLFLAAGCAQGIFHWLRRSHTMSRWPTAVGTIISSWKVLDGERIRYEYQVAGHKYVGRRIGYEVAGGSSTADPIAQELAEKYPPGAEVKVYYNPSHPATAVLEPRNMQNATMSVVFTIAFGFFGVVFLALAMR